MKKTDRIWELDALRGLCILCVILIHLIFDLIYFIGLDLHLPAWYVFIQQYGGVIFVVLSGCCATLGSRSFRRGCIVFACGMLISLVTFGMYRLGMASRDVIVWFGVLHLLGICMMLYPLFKRLPVWALTVLGAAFVAAGVWLASLAHVDVKFPSFWGLLLSAVGIRPTGFYSADYFPLFPNFGWFLLGAFLGKTAYRRRESLLPKVNADFFLLRFFRFCGRHSLLIYLVHQPVLAGLVMLFTLLK